MTTFQVIGAHPALSLLIEQLVQHGATQVAEDGDLILVAALPTVADNNFSAVPVAARTRSIVVGLTEGPCALGSRGTNTIYQFLETFRPLGTITPMAIERWGEPAFVGPKRLARRMDAVSLKALSTDSYSAWITRGDPDAGAFLLRLLEVARNLPAGDDVEDDG